MLGALLGNYRVVEQLSEGSMGVVYLGRHETLGRSVVVKVLQPELSSNGDMVQRFFNEAQAATAIRNPGIVHVFDFGTTPEGRAFLVMELLEGESLAARLRQRRFDHLECCRLGRQVANVLQAAHAAGITHRDLKPANLFLVRDPEVIGGERVKVLDFGLAKLASEAHASNIKTRTGLMMGSPTYMSPEQCRSLRTADARSDIYALGCILFEMTCGRPPFIGHGMGDIVGAHMYKPPPAPQSFAPDMPPELSALIAQMLEKAPDARPQTMAAVSQALDAIVSALGGGAPARPSTPPPMRAATAQPAHAPTAQPAPNAGPVRAGASAGPAPAVGSAPAVALPPDAMTASPTLPRSARPSTPSPARAPTAQPARASTPPPAPPEPTLHEPTLYEPTMHEATESSAPEPTMVLSDPTLMPVSDAASPSPSSARAPTPWTASSSAPPQASAQAPWQPPASAPPPAGAPAPWPAPNSAPPQAGAAAPWPAPNSAPRQAGGHASWPAPNAAPPQAGGHAPWPAPNAAPPQAGGPMPFPASASPTPFAYPATPSPVPQSTPAAPTSGAPSSSLGPQPNVAALQRAFIRGGLGIVGGVVAIAIVLGTCNSDSPERQGSHDDTIDAPRPADAAVTSGDAAAAAAQSPALQTAPVAAVTATAAEPTKSPAPPDALESECRNLQENRKWAELEQCADKLQPLDAKRAAELKTRAAEEAKAAPRIAAFETALRDKNLRRARTELEQIWAESVELPELKRKFESAETQAITDLTAQLERMKSADCAAYNALLAKERTLKPTRVTSEAARRLPCTLPPAPASTPAKCNADALAQKGQEQYAKSQFAAALASYESAYACKASPQLAQKAFLVACNLRSVPKAKTHWKRLSLQLRTQAVGTCVRNGITEATLNAP